MLPVKISGLATRLLRCMLMCSCGFCRMWDAFDFATVSLTVTEVAKEFGVENSDVTWVST
jgi:hypothetical protein